MLCFPDTADCQIDVGNIFFFEDGFYFIDKQICQVPEKLLIERQKKSFDMINVSKYRIYIF